MHNKLRISVIGSLILCASFVFAAKESSGLDKLTQMSPLHMAVLSGQHDKVQDLINIGYSPLTKDYRKRTSLDLASFANSQKIRDILVKAITNLLEESSNESYALHKAVILDDQEKVKKIAKKSNINNFNSDGDTAFHIACKQVNHHMIQLLQSLGAQMLPNPKTGKTPFDILFIMQERTLVLEAKYAPQKTEKKEDEKKHQKLIELFQSAVNSQNLNLLNKLIEKDPGLINSKTNLTFAFYKAIAANNDELFDYLVSKTKINLKLFIDKLNKEAETYFTFHKSCIEHNSPKILEKLLQINNDINCLDIIGLTLLIRASGKGLDEIVKLLIKYGADVNKTSSKNETALYRSLVYHKFDVAKILIDNGANLEETAFLNSTLLVYACSAGDKLMLKFLIQEGANINARDNKNLTGLAYAIKAGHTYIVKILLDNNVDTQNIDDDNSDALIYAAHHGQNEIVDVLLSRGFEINPKKCGCTALANAAVKGHVDIVKKLVEAKANIEVNGCEGTPLIMAAKSRQPEVIDYLTQIGANVEAKDKEGNTTFTIAKQKKYFDVSKVLTKHRKQLEKTNQVPDNQTNATIYQIHRDREDAELLRKRNSSTALLQAILAGNKESARKLNSEGNKLFGVDDTKENRKLLYEILEEKPEAKYSQAKVEQPKAIINKPAKAKSGNKKKKNKPAAAKQYAKEPKEYIQVKQEQLPKADPISADIYEAVLASLNRDSSVLELLTQKEKEKTEEKFELKSQVIEPVYIDYGNDKIKVDIAHLVQGFAGNDGLYHGLHIDFNKSLERKNKLKTVKVYPNACYDVEIIDQVLLDQINTSYYGEIKQRLQLHLDTKYSNLVLGYLASENNRKSFFPYKWNNRELISAISDALHNIKSINQEGKDIVIIGERLPKHGEDARYPIKIKIILTLKNGEAAIKTAFPVK